MEEVDAILKFWFGTQNDDAAVAEEKAALWWGKDAEIDLLIADRFGALRGAAVRGELDGWESQPRSRLAAIVLVDQFSRSLFRDSGEAFAHDALARRWCLDGLDAKHDQALRPIERVFFYLPLAHSVSRRDQALSVSLFEALAASVAPEQRQHFENFVDFARRHQVIVERFDRFPHRNAVLGRESTAEELAFLRGPNSSF